MRTPERTSLPASPSGLLGSYVAELRGWVAQIATGYALAAAMLVAGGCSIAVAVGIGVAAVFHWLEARYGDYVAYGTLGGLFLLIGIVGVSVGVRLLGRRVPVPPRPRRQTRALKRAIALSAISRALDTRNAESGFRPDKVTQTLAGAAAAAFLGWIASSYIRRSSVTDREAK